MSHANLEDLLRSHYYDIANRAVTNNREFDPTPIVSTQTSAEHPNRWRLVGAAAAAVITVGGLGYIALRPTTTVTPAQVPAPPQTLAGETEEQASFRVWSECMTGHGITIATTRGEDGGLLFSGPDDATTQRAVEDCQAVLIDAGLAQP